MLIYPDKFVFVHVPHTAGTWVRFVLKACLPGWIDGPHQHTRASLIPVEFRDLPVYTNVREPLDWYRAFARHHTSLDLGNNQTPYRYWYGEILDFSGIIRLKFEKLRSEWLSVLTLHKLLNRKLERLIVESQKVNSASDRPLPSYWNDEEIHDLIRKDRDLVIANGYRC